MNYKELMSTVIAKPKNPDREKVEVKDYCLTPTDRKVMACALDTGRELYYDIEPRKVDPDCGSTFRDPDKQARVREPHTPVIRERTKTPNELKQDLKARLKAEVKRS